MLRTIRQVPIHPDVRSYFFANKKPLSSQRKKVVVRSLVIGTYLAKSGRHFPTLVQTRSGSKGLEVLLRSQLFGGQSSAGKAPLVVKKNIQFICCCSNRIIIFPEVKPFLSRFAFQHGNRNAGNLSKNDRIPNRINRIDYIIRTSLTYLIKYAIIM